MQSKLKLTLVIKLMSENRISSQISNVISKVALGAAKNKTQLELTGITTSLTRSFKPTAIACSVPQNPVTFGPFRR